MRRADRAQDRDFCLSVIDRCTHGVAALTTGEDTPYCLPSPLSVWVTASIFIVPVRGVRWSC